MFEIHFISGLKHPHGVEGAHDFLGKSANTSIRQSKGEVGQALVPTPTLETNKKHFIRLYLKPRSHCYSAPLQIPDEDSFHIH